LSVSVPCNSRLFICPFVVGAETNNSPPLGGNVNVNGPVSTGTESVATLAGTVFGPRRSKLRIIPSWAETTKLNAVRKQASTRLRIHTPWRKIEKHFFIGRGAK